MKKRIAILLILVMVLPTCLVARAENANKEIKPFYLVNWNDATGYDYVYGAVYIRFKDYKEGSYGVTAYVNWNGEYSENIISIAEIVKAEFDKRPEGTRYLKILRQIDQIVEPEYMIYLDKGAQLYARWFEEFCKEYKSIGGKLDGVSIDLEYNEVNSSYIRKAYKTTSTIIDEDGNTVTLNANKQIYNQIVNHPSYATRVRPLLEAQGFQFSEPVGDMSEIFSINDAKNLNADIWDAAMRNLLCGYVNEACAPILKYFPDATVSNYRFSSSKGWLESVGQKGEHSLGGNTMYAGNTANENFYVRRPLKQFFETTKGFNKPVFYNGAVYEDTSFNSFLYEINTFKDMYESSDTKRINAWVAGFNYNHANAPDNGTRLTPYYSEAILHMGLLDISTFIGYIVGPRDTDLEGEPYKYADNMQVFSDLLSELTRMVGASDRKVIAIPTQWNSAFVLSGMSAGGKNVWRLTPDTSITSLESFKVAGKDPTFKINGQTITFPGGKIVEDSKVSHIGTCGYWIETPADVTPVITNDVDRYSQFPSFKENYNDYKTGMVYSYENVKYPSSWEIKKSKNATAVIEEDKGNAGNKVLAVTGDVTLKNVKVIENVTAGDTYAENQGWEITVTIPANMSAEETVTLLAIYSALERPIDGGFQIMGGKLYYYNSDKYVALEGVALTAGGKFTLKREVDFNTADAFTSDYTVYDSAGKMLASVEDVPASTKVKLPVQGIGISTDNVSGVVYLDDYKLYATGVATDFMLYDEKNGLRVTELDQARTANTAYRLSWLNGTAYEKIYTIIAAYYNGDSLVEEKVVREVKMAPGSDSVEIGIVEVKAGQSVRVYLRDDSKPEPSDTGNDINIPTGTQPDNSKPEPGGEVDIPNTTLPDSNQTDPGDATGIPDNTLPDDGQTEPSGEKNDSTDTKSDRKNTWGLIAIIAGAVILAAAGAAAVVFIRIKKKQATSAAKSENTAEPEDKPVQRSDT